MRAWQVTGQGEPRAVIHEGEVEFDAAGPGELIIRVAAAGLGFPDVLMCRGTYPLTPPVPFTPGQEFVGTVTAVGDGVGVAVGTRVMGVAAFMIGRGSFGERCKTYETMTYPVAAAMSDADAAGFTIAYHTGLIALKRRAQLAAGETLLVHGGSGGTGAAAIQLGKALGARVIATAGGAAKAATCRSLGADHVIDHTADDFATVVNDVTGGRGANVIYDPVGGEVFEASINCLAQEGRLLPIGFASGRWGVVSPQLLAFKNASIVGVLAGTFDRDYMLGMHNELLTMYSDGRIKPVIDHQIGFSGIGSALQDLADRKVVGRVVAVY